MNKLTGIIDVALVDSLCGRDDLKDLLQKYGMVIMDECHHGASAGAQIVLGAVPCKYLYGVSATPVRGDHLERINYMLLGPIRSTYSAKERAVDQGIDHLIRPRFTRVADTLEKNAGINEKYELLRDSTVRNDQIIRDIRICIGYGRTVAVITRYKNFYDSFILIATGQKIGEGFNFPRLDTLILGTPISDPGRVEQYVGRLNRDYPGKKNVVVYDYVDSHIYTFDNMYRKRLRTYRRIGYRVAADDDLRWLNIRAFPSEKLEMKDYVNTIERENTDFVNSIYDAGNYMETFERDLLQSQKSIVIESPQLDQNKVDRFVRILSNKAEDGIRIKVIVLDPSIADYDNEEHILFMILEMKNAGISVVTTKEYGSHFAVIDNHLVWYGGMNLFGKEDVWDNLMRIKDAEAAQELLLLAQEEENNQL